METQVNVGNNVPHYWKIDYGQVFDVLHQNLDDLRAFAAAVLRLL